MEDLFPDIYGFFIVAIGLLAINKRIDKKVDTTACYECKKNNQREHDQQLAYLEKIHAKLDSYILNNSTTKS